jgi:septal ring factor EnvC (AmiA/AmiB activator)
LEQSFHDAIPLIRSSLDRVIENQNSLKELVVELAEQSKKFPAIDEDMREMRKDINQLSVRVDRQEIATKSLDTDFSKFVDEEFKEFRADFREVTNSLNKNSWTLGLVRFVVVSLFGGAITLLATILAGGI